MTSAVPAAADAPLDGASPLVRVQRLAVRHEGADAASPADASFDVGLGEVVLLLGPSGAGKSTLALTLNGLIPQSIPAELSGTVAVAGRDAATTPVAQLSTHVGMVFQDPDAQLVTGTLLDEVAFGPENLRLPVDEVLARTEAALRRVGLWDRRHENPDRLSGGGRQRLAIACALAMGSELLVLDEPTANLDPQGIEEVYAALADLVAEGGRSIVLIEHNLDTAVAFADRVVVLDADGRTAVDGTVDVVLRERADELHAMGVWLPVSTLAALQLRAAGWTFDRLPLTPDELRAAVDVPAFPSPAVPNSVSPGPNRPNQPESAVSPAGRLNKEHAAHGDPDPHPAAGPAAAAASSSAAPAAGASSPSPAVPNSVSPGPDRPNRPESADFPAGRLNSEHAAATAEAAVEVRGLTLRRGRAEVLHDVDLTVRAGEFVAIVGANGAGKTSLVQAIAGVVPAPRGTVHVGGVDVARAELRTLSRRIGFVFQNPEHQFIAHTVFDEIAHGLRLQRLPDDEVAARTFRLLDRFGLRDKADLHPFLLSGGQKRRLSVGTALVGGAPVLALDEPTFGQDRARADELLRLLQQLNADGTTILVVTHDMQLVTEYAQRTVVVDDGRIIADAATAAVFADDALLDRAGLRRPPLARALHGVRHPALADLTRLADLPGATRLSAAAPLGGAS